ncbi:hypothetical protein VHEMI09275 [[Torrubiella] hemipterigena]|uniref:Aminoglycoside phosphotransferase domain-containing protein n=1 Tax=[Torrubiella] hemipterigena TaxID=1531966 RepID=A0A0A1TR97_9HYPO|nr:hypothetical protein VHEMI09275 [[Torrubiella] hemipterigena]
MYEDRQDFNNDVWDANDLAHEAAETKEFLAAVVKLAVDAVQRRLNEPAIYVKPIQIGGFNIHIRIKSVGSDLIVRLPRPHYVQFPNEKMEYEAATAMVIREATPVPIPRQLEYNNKHPTLGPFIIMDYIENKGDMVNILTIPGLDPAIPPVLKPDISDATLLGAYSKIASCLFHISTLKFSQIGSLSEVNSSYSVRNRPITQNMNVMMQLGGIPEEVLPPPNKTYTTANDWYVMLSEMHLSQLLFQHNDTIFSTEDCLNKYVSRQLFRNLASEGKLSTFGFSDDTWSAQGLHNRATLPAPDRSTDFRIWCDDRRPVNFLVGKDGDVAACVDFEFAYVAPTQFTLDPPWWLLLEQPEMWADGMKCWSNVFESRMPVGLAAVRQVEKRLNCSFPLPSQYMQESWLTGRFWLTYAARKSWAFDAIYWNFLDERFLANVRPDCLSGERASIGSLLDNEN